ncbi:MAG TPA: metal-dependent hydrolase [Terriglobia bacterium]|nr:metal-dependent hydrolase [Terriglobia bacterium]
MFNSTHTFVGLAVARCGMDRWVPRAAITAVVAANLPDIDIVTALSGTPAYLHYHRGITHSLTGIPVLALMLTAAMYIFSGNFWRTYLVALVAMATHPALDYSNTYGLRPFLPWYGTWYYGDVLPIIDPYLDAVLLIGILAGEVSQNSRRLMTWLSLGLVFLYLGARSELRNLARSQIEILAARTPGTEKWGVSPEILNPLVWDGIVQSSRQMLKVSIDPLDQLMTEITRIERAAPAEIPRQALESESASVLLQFVRFPVMRLYGTDYGYRVLIFDFRFYNETTNTALGSEIVLDRSFHITKESLSFQKIIE